jgi:hypothetical protein
MEESMIEPRFSGPSQIWLELCRRVLEDFDSRTDYADRDINGALVVSQYIQKKLDK